MGHSTQDARTPAVLAGLTVSRLLVARVLPDRWHVTVNLATAGVVLGVAMGAHDVDGDPLDLGLSASRVRAGLEWGAMGTTAVAVGLLAVRARRPAALRDARAAGLTARDTAGAVLVRIPLGTVVPEELVFRVALPALLARPDRPGWWPGLVSSLLFGVWHVLPPDELTAGSPVAAAVVSRAGRTAARAGQVALLSAVGAGLHELRRRTGSVVAPAMVHATANTLGLLVARHAEPRGA